MPSFDRHECPICHRLIAENWRRRHMREHGGRGENPRPLPDRTWIDHTFTVLPCGKQVNQERRNQCCRTECPEKSFREIDRCYAENMQRNPLRGSGLHNWR